MKFDFRQPKKSEQKADIVMILAALMAGSFIVLGVLSLSPHSSSSFSILVETNRTISIARYTTLCNVLYQRGR